jgi:replicative DNA helicase
MEPMKESSNVTRLPGAEDIRLREPPHNFEAEQALLGAILINNAAYQRVAVPPTSPAWRRRRCT